MICIVGLYLNSGLNIYIHTLNYKCKSNSDIKTVWILGKNYVRKISFLGTKDININCKK